MKVSEIKSCYIGPEISPEQYIQEHFFLYLVKGAMTGYDGHRSEAMKPGDYCIAVKNHLARYNKQKENDEFEKVVVVFDEAFLKDYQEKYKPAIGKQISGKAFIALEKDKLIPEFLRSLVPYYDNQGKIEETFSRIKREELMLILLRSNPGLADVFFNFKAPEKIDLEAFMNQNYKFNVSIERFAYLTGRSLSAFKRDFDKIFQSTPGNWLVQKRLEQAYFLIDKKRRKPSEIYLDLGFEDLSHFSFAFKKQFGKAPSEV